jgi:hypothetical protein
VRPRQAQEIAEPQARMRGEIDGMRKPGAARRQLSRWNLAPKKVRGARHVAWQFHAANVKVAHPNDALTLLI